MIKLYKLDALQSDKAQQLLKDLSPHKQTLNPSPKKLPKKPKNHKLKKNVNLKTKL
jgi:hypothetical protein